MLKVRVKVLRGFAELGELVGELDETKLPMHQEGEAQPEKCLETLKGHLVRMENAANGGPLRLHLGVEE